MYGSTLRKTASRSTSERNKQFDVYRLFRKRLRALKDLKELSPFVTLQPQNRDRFLLGFCDKSTLTGRPELFCEKLIYSHQMHNHFTRYSFETEMQTVKRRTCNRNLLSTEFIPRMKGIQPLYSWQNGMNFSEIYSILKQRLKRFKKHTFFQKSTEIIFF